MCNALDIQNSNSCLNRNCLLKEVWFGLFFLKTYSSKNFFRDQVNPSVLRPQMNFPLKPSIWTNNQTRAMLWVRSMAWAFTVIGRARHVRSWLLYLLVTWSLIQTILTPRIKEFHYFLCNKNYFFSWYWHFYFFVKYTLSRNISIYKIYLYILSFVN